MIPYRHKRRMSTKLVARTLVISALPLTLCLAVMYISVSSQLSIQLNRDIDKSFRQFEKIFMVSDAVARKNIALEHKPCAYVAAELKREAARQLYIRSINLISDGEIYCSSVFETPREYPQVSSAMHNVSTLVPGNTLTPNSPVLYFRQANVLVAIDGRLLMSFLHTSTPGIKLLFIINGRELHDSGWIYPEGSRLNGEERHSPEWDFSLRAQPQTGVEWEIIRDNYLPIILLFVLATLTLLAYCIRSFLCEQLTEQDLRNALNRGEFVPYAQPLFDCTGNILWGVEIVARWKEQNGRTVPADLFIPLAENTGVILELTQSMFEQTGLELAAAVGLLPEDFHVAFNISNQCCKTTQLADMCLIFSQVSGNKIALTLEFNARESFQHSKTLNSLIQMLKEEGVTLAIDHFGTADANLDYLSEIAFDFIKIDKSYVDSVGKSAANDHIIDNILDLAKRLQIDVVAEGIENQQQVTYLYSRGVRYFQGNFFSAPLPIDTFITKYLRSFL